MGRKKKIKIDTYPVNFMIDPIVYTNEKGEMADMRGSLEQMVRIFHACAHESRLRILNLLLLSEQLSGEPKVAAEDIQIALGRFSDADISLHAEILEKAGLIWFLKKDMSLALAPPPLGRWFLKAFLERYLFVHDVKENTFAADGIRFLRQKRFKALPKEPV